ncbi:MAG: RNA polymerase sigma factor [Candidatus Omnitrophota bacterium]|jgi:RNA polymerase sigma-70 factor (ECF subfamily)
MADDNTQDLQQLLMLCARGDDRAWASFIEIFAPLVNRAIRHKALSFYIRLSAGDADEIFQQTFTNIWRRKSFDRISNASSIQAYLTVIAQHTAVDFFRKSISHENVKEACWRSGVYEPYRQKGPRDIAEDNCLNETVNEYIEALTIKERRVMSLELVHGLKHREIARLMDIPVNTVSTIISRLKRALKERLEEKGYGT